MPDKKSTPSRRRVVEERPPRREVTRKQVKRWEKKRQRENRKRLKAGTYKPRGLGFVYAIRAGNGPIKIGWSTDPDSRLLTLRIGNPTPLELLAAFPAHASYEKQLHKKFRHLRIQGEWFQCFPEVFQEFDLPVEGPLLDEHGTPYTVFTLSSLDSWRASCAAQAGIVYGPAGEEWVLEEDLALVVPIDNSK